MAKDNKKEKKEINLKQLLKLEISLYKKKDAITEDLVVLVSKDTKNKKIKSLINKYVDHSEKLDFLAEVIDKKIKEEKKAEAKAGKKKEAVKSKKKAKKIAVKVVKSTSVTKTAQPVKKAAVVKKVVAKKKTVVASKPVVVDNSAKSVDLNAKTAIGHLGAINSLEALNTYLTGEKRLTVLKRAESRKNVLTK